MPYRRKKVALALVPMFLAMSGCGYDPSQDGAPMQRDVYTKVEDCIADWGNAELCSKVADAERAQFAKSVGVAHDGGSSIIFWGPSYYSGSRSVDYGGRSYTPLTSRAMSKPFSVTPNSSSFARSSPGTASRPASGVSSSGSSSRGGFGSSGHSASAGSSGG